MFFTTCLIFLLLGKSTHAQGWNTTGNLSAWESFLNLGEIKRPLGLTLNRSSLAHRHFAIGYLCLHSFMYSEATKAFDLALEIDDQFIEAYIGKLLAYVLC